MKISKITVLLLSGLAAGNISAITIPGAGLLSSLSFGHNKTATGTVLAGGLVGAYRLGMNEEVRNHLMENKGKTAEKLGLGVLSLAGICTVAKHARAVAPQDGFVGTISQGTITTAKMAGLGWAGYKLLKGLETLEDVQTITRMVDRSEEKAGRMIAVLRAEEGLPMVQALQQKDSNGEEFAHDPSEVLTQFEGAKRAREEAALSRTYNRGGSSKSKRK